jgi:Putative DNA-binding domain
MTNAASHEAFARALLDGRLAPPAGLRAWNGSDPAPRFAVYRNNVLVSLSQALAAGFPVTRELVGGEFFDAMAREYVMLEPPTSPVLVEYGDGFAGFIERFPPAGGVPYLADVARLERMRVRAHHAPDAPLLASETLQALMADPGRLAGLRVRLHPACQVLRSRFAVFSIWAAHQLDGSDQRGAALATVRRPLLEVSAMSLPTGTADFLQALANGEPLAEAATASGRIPGFDLQASLTVLITPGVVGG